MKYFKILLPFLFLVTLLSCGGKEGNENDTNEANLTNLVKMDADTLDIQSSNDTLTGKSTTEEDPTNNTLNDKNSDKNMFHTKNEAIDMSSSKNKAEIIINSPLRNLLNHASTQIGKSYTQQELIERYKFPQEAVELIKAVKSVGPNKLYFIWGSTWFVEKVSDAEFKNDTLTFTFKRNLTYISGGAIGIKHNKKIYTDLIFKNGAAYIPSIKGYHWDIGK